jgi:hypothetical protein
MNEKQIKDLIGKLRQPIHINYISKYILKKNIEETKKELDFLIESGIIVESNTAKGFYVVI